MSERANTSDQALALAEESFIWREVDGQVIVLDKRDWSYLAINASGAELWKAIAEGATRADLVERLRETYGLDEQTAVGDVDTFIATMRSQELLRAGPGAG